jgi:hypothetical protein
MDTELVIEVHISDIVELQVVGLAGGLLIVITARNRDQLEITDDDDSKFRFVELSVERTDVSCQERGCAQFLRLGMDSKDPLAHYQRRYLELLYHLEHFLYSLFVEKWRLLIILEH